MSLRTGIVPITLYTHTCTRSSPYTLPKKVIRCALTPFFWKGISNLPTAVQTLLGGSPHRGRIAAPTVPYDLPLVRLMYEYSWTRGMKYRTGTSTYCLPACMQGGRQEGRHPERFSNESRTNPERIPNAPRPTMRAPVSTCSAVQYRTTCREAGSQAGIPNESRTNPKRIPNVSRTHPVRQ